ANRQPINAGDGNINSNDTMFLVFRVTIIYDTTPPTFSGLPTGCNLWPPNHKMIDVGTVTASDSQTGIEPGSFSITATGTGGSDADIAVTPDQNGGFVVQLRAERGGNEGNRVYTITATARDRVGNVAMQQAVCVVPHDQGRSTNGH